MSLVNFFSHHSFCYDNDLRNILCQINFRFKTTIFQNPPQQQCFDAVVPNSRIHQYTTIATSSPKVTITSWTMLMIQQPDIHISNHNENNYHKNCKYTSGNSHSTIMASSGNGRVPVAPLCHAFTPSVLPTPTPPSTIATPSAV